MDFSMPFCDGPTATRQIRELIDGHFNDLKQPFICVLTAYNDENTRKVAEEAGCDKFFVKPVFKTQLQ